MKKDNGKSRRSIAQLVRQEDIYFAHIVERKTMRSLAREYGLNLETVRSDIKHEFLRRAKEREEKREADLESSVIFYEGVIRKAMMRHDVCNAILASGGRISGDSSLADAIRAQERIDKLYGLDAPTKIDLGLQTLLDAMEPRSQEGDEMKKALPQ